MANKANLLQRNTGQDVSEAAFNAASAGHNVFGCGMVVNGVLMTQHQDEPITYARFKELIQAFNDAAIICYFGTHSKDSSKDDIQPYCLGDDKDTKLAVFLAGDYSSFARAGSSRPSEFHAHEKGVLPQFHKYYESVKAGEEVTIKGFMDYLESPDVSKAMINLSTSYGVLKIMGDTGEIKTYPQSQHYGKFPWGDMADVNGFEEKSFPEKKEEKSNPLANFFGKKVSPEASKTSVPPIKTEEKKVVPIPEKKDDKKELTVEEVLLPGMVMARPSTALNKDKTKQKWYQQKHGPNLIKDWQKRPWVAIKAEDVDQMTEVKDLTAFQSALNKAIEMKEKQAEANKAAQLLATTVVPPKMKEDFKNIFLQSKEISSTLEGVQTIPTIEALNDDEKKTPTFFDHTGLHVEQTLNWSMAKLEELHRDYLPIYKSLLKAYRVRLVKALREQPKKEKAAVPETVKDFFGKKKVA